MGQVPCQNCGRCSHAAVDRADWSPAWDAGGALPAGCGAGSAPDVRPEATGSARDLSEPEVMVLVRDLVRQFSGLGGAAAGQAAGAAAAAGRNPMGEHGLEVPVGISVRHLHICQRDLDILYGLGSRLTRKNDLYEPGEFASHEVVTVVGPKLRTLENVRILGPLRDFTQVELSRTDAFAVGLDLPMRKSGDLVGAAPITVVGPCGSITLPNGAIRSNRHIHMDPADAARFGVNDNDIVRVRVPGEEGVIYENVQVRVKEGWLLTLHVDTDDANASNLFCNMKAYLLP